MKVFESINEFVSHYKEKKTIPKNAEITINGNVHSFERITINNNSKFDNAQWDKYIFREDDFVARLGIELKVNYLRYFDEKVLFETYFELHTPFGNEHKRFGYEYKQFERLICPVYFYDQFITEEDYHLDGKQHHSNSLEKWTGLKWVNTRLDSYNFIEFRLRAFNELLQELNAKAIFQRKLKISDRHAFINTISVPDSWREKKVDEYDDDDY